MKPIAAIAAILALTPLSALAQEHDHAGHAEHEAHAQADAGVVAAHETALRETIAAMQAGAVNYHDFGPELAAAVREQEAAVAPMMQGLGAIQTIEHKGEEQGAQQFRVVFENAPTDWFITLNGETIVGLVFRPAQ